MTFHVIAEANSGDRSIGRAEIRLGILTIGRSRLAHVEIGFENLGDPMPAFLEMGPAGVVDGQVLRFQDLADPAGDLLQVQPGEGAGVGRHRAVSASAGRP